MTFDDILAQVMTLLKRQGRVSYGALKRRFDLDDAYLEDLKGEILYVHRIGKCIFLIPKALIHQG